MEKKTIRNVLTQETKEKINNGELLYHWCVHFAHRTTIIWHNVMVFWVSVFMCEWQKKHNEIDYITEFSTYRTSIVFWNIQQSFFILFMCISNFLTWKGTANNNNNEFCKQSNEFFFVSFIVCVCLLNSTYLFYHSFHNFFFIFRFRLLLSYRFSNFTLTVQFFLLLLEKNIRKRMRRKKNFYRKITIFYFPTWI